MKRLILAAMLLIASSLTAQTYAQFGFGGYCTSNNATGCTVSANSTNPSVAGDNFTVSIVMEGVYPGYSFTISDTDGDVFSICIPATTYGTGTYGLYSITYCGTFSHTNIAEHIVVSFPLGETFIVGLTQYSGRYSVPDQTKTNINSGTGTITTGATPNTTSAVELCVATFVSNRGTTNTAISTPYTSRISVQSPDGYIKLVMGDYVTSSTGPQSASGTMTASYQAVGSIVTLKQNTVLVRGAQASVF